MPIFNKTIFTGFAPNLTGRDTLTALAYLCFPWKWLSWRQGGYAGRAEKKIKNYFGVSQAKIFDSGRSALFFALKALSAEQGTEVLVQAYTCVVVANAITQTGATPVYLDVGDDFNLDPEKLESKITARSKILIIQHTFGQPARLDKLLAIAKKHNLKIIEDCAHSLGARYQGKLLGTFGHLGMLSFGSDKIISCARGGALITGDETIGQQINNFQENLPPSSRLKIFQHLMHYPAFYLGKALYSLKIGKIILKLAKNLNIINKIIYPEEKAGERGKNYPARLPDCLAKILVNQLADLEKTIIHQKKIAALYDNLIDNKNIYQPFKAQTDCVYLRYPILTNEPKSLVRLAKQQAIILGDWYSTPIAPGDINLGGTSYKPGDCPKAEALARQSVNLPTDRQISQADAERIIKFINSF
ncbi:MAG: aminotransferase class I/II-fold pyridoxal phosphate-dependent enzyme [bacterium]|nr:aminotransferase class I/II-fold pyridoxal phosphate-dependent enzyme [bacterium]